MALAYGSEDFPVEADEIQAAGGSDGSSTSGAENSAIRLEIGGQLGEVREMEREVQLLNQILR